MYSEKESLEYLVNLGETKILDIGGHKYSTKDIQMIKEPKPALLKATTLTALIEYLKSGIDKKCSEKLLVHIVNPSKVELYSELREDKDRETYFSCEALLPDNICFGDFIGTEEFNIMLQSSFVENDDRDILLKITGTIQDSAVKEIGDDGVTQAVTIKTGIAKVGDAKVPNPVVLAPFRTFPEITQPESSFIFRMQSGPRAALFEADGGAWRNEAMNRIAEYLKDSLADLPNVKVIS